MLNNIIGVVGRAGINETSERLQLRVVPASTEYLWSGQLLHRKKWRRSWLLVPLGDCD